MRLTNLTPEKRVLLNFLLLTIASLIMSQVSLFGIKPVGYLALFIIICALLYFSYFSAEVRLVKISSFLERYALWFLVIWIVVFLAWCGLVLFSDPYRYGINHGDATFFAQTLWNLANGFNPENSYFTFNGLPLTPDDDPRYANTYGYVSIFSLHQSWLPIALLTPLYALFSQPPMHIFAMQVCIIVIGLPGVYWASRQAGSSNSFGLLAAIGYSLLPQLDTQLFFKGYYDVLALGIMPWLFGALIGKKWSLVYLFSLLVALISYPHTYLIMIIGLSITLFFRAILPGIAVMLIGWSIMKIDMAIFLTAVSPYHTDLSTLPSFFQTYVIERSYDEFIYNFKVYIAYIVSFLQGLAFLPLLGLRRNGKWNTTILGFWFILTGAFSIMLLRSAGWEFQRNSFLIVPLYMMAIITAVNLQNEFNIASQKRVFGSRYRNTPTALLVISMVVLIIFGSRYYLGGSLASHLPWGNNGYFLHSRKSVQDWDMALAKFNAIIPKNASIAWRAGPEVQAFLANRQHTWHMGREPKEVKYYVFIGAPMNQNEGKEWGSLYANLSQNNTYKLLYKGTPGKPLIVFENLKAQPVPRNEKLLGWNVLGKVFSNKEELIGSAIRKNP